MIASFAWEQFQKEKFPTLDPKSGEYAREKEVFLNGFAVCFELVAYGVPNLGNDAACALMNQIDNELNASLEKRPKIQLVHMEMPATDGVKTTKLQFEKYDA